MMFISVPQFYIPLSNKQFIKKFTISINQADSSEYDVNLLRSAWNF